MVTVVYQTNKKQESLPPTSQSPTGIRKRSSPGRNENESARWTRRDSRSLPHENESFGQLVRASSGGMVPITRTSHSFYGATYLFDRIGEDTGVTEDLKTCFPDNYRQILSISYYLITPMNRFPCWAAPHKHPNGGVISFQQRCELFAALTEETRQRFFQLQAKRRVEKEYLVYDSTSVSSYSKSLRQVRYGKNKGLEHLNLIHLSLLLRQQSRLPFYYRKLSGNIPDVKTLKKLKADMTARGDEKIKVVLDRGFFSTANMNDLCRHHVKFLIAVNLSLKLLQIQLDTVRDTMRSWNNYSQDHQLYVYSLPVTWNDVQGRPYKGDTIQTDRKIYLPIYMISRIGPWRVKKPSTVAWPIVSKSWKAGIDIRIMRSIAPNILRSKAHRPEK